MVVSGSLEATRSEHAGEATKGSGEESGAGGGCGDVGEGKEGKKGEKGGGRGSGGGAYGQGAGEHAKGGAQQGEEETLISSISRYNSGFFVETHSLFRLLRFGLLVRESAVCLVVANAGEHKGAVA